MPDDAVLDVAARFGLDPEVVGELLAALAPATAEFTRGDAPTTTPLDAALPGADHLSRQTLLGSGGTSDVYEALDRRLGRRVAMKVLRPELAIDPQIRSQFLREARATAQLVHPGIIPLHEIGELDDGRPFFTMAVVEGQTLGEVAHAAGGPPEGSALRHLIELFRRAVDAVAYAHGEGALHRDLKPANIMVGRFGTVFVLDWGLFRAQPEARARFGLPPGATQLGAVSGTPGYLSPEQARGESLTAASDVFSLGLVLHELLHGHPAYVLARPQEAFHQVREGVVPPPTAGPDALRDIVVHATEAAPAARFPDASALANAVGRWLTGEAQRAQALTRVATARELERQEADLRASATAAKATAKAELRKLPTWAPATDKQRYWRELDAADGNLSEADSLQLRRLQVLHGALTLDATCPEARDDLATHWKRAHQAAEHAGDLSAAREAASQLAYHDRGKHRGYLEGTGSLELDTTPSGLRATLYRVVERDRILVPEDPTDLGVTPVSRPLAMGSYLVVIHGPVDVRVPVWIRRNHRWHNPVVPVVEERALAQDDCYIPPGPFWMGMAQGEFQSGPGHFEDVDGFVIQRFPVTHRQYIRFLDTLVDEGHEALALKVAPRERAARPDQLGALCYRRDEVGHFHLAPDADGDVWDPEWPVFFVNHAGASAYARWHAEQTGQPWRLPTEREWEKAARGVDGRRYPWGNRFDASFACTRASHPGRQLPAPVQAYPVDCSVYGVRGMAGNVRDWCADRFFLPGQQPDPNGSMERVVRGGCFFFPATGAHTAARFGLNPDAQADTVGFRLARALEPADSP